MTINLRKLSGFSAGLLATGALAACGGVPGNAVVSVDGETIKKSTYDHWTQIIANSQRAQTGQKGKALVPDAPSFKRCIADKKTNAPKPAKGQPEPTEAQFKQQCEQEAEQIKTQALQLLIRSTWLDQEARRQGVEVTEKEITKRVNEQRKQSFPNEKDWNEFLAQLGAAPADIEFDARQGLLEQKITEKITKGSEKVTDREIQNYYNKNKKQFADPERRDLRIVLTKTEARAEEAKKALEGDQSWKAVTKRFSIDEATKAQGGVLVGVVKGQQEKALDDAIFKAEKGELSGPVKTQFGWYVFEVTKVTPAKQRPLKEVKAQIKQIVQSEKRNKAINDFSKEYRDRWKEKTDCRDDFVTPDCKNGPSDEEAAKQNQQPGQPGQQPGGPPPGGQPGQPQPAPQQQQPPATDE